MPLDISSEAAKRGFSDCGVERDTWSDLTRSQFLKSSQKQGFDLDSVQADPLFSIR